MRRLATIGVVAALLFGAARAWAARCDLNSYASEINSATANQVITLPAGTCTGNITITNTAPFTLQGGAGGTTLEPTSLRSERDQLGHRQPGDHAPGGHVYRQHHDHQHGSIHAPGRRGWHDARADQPPI